MTQEQHRRGGIDEYPICVGCCDDWPCDFIQGFRAGLEAVQAKMHDLNTYSYRHDWQALSDWIDAEFKETGE